MRRGTKWVWGTVFWPDTWRKWESHRKKPSRRRELCWPWKDSYQEFKCLANDNFVGFCKIKIGSPLGNYGSLVQCKYKEKCVYLSLKCCRGLVCVFSPKWGWPGRGELADRGKERDWEVGRKAVFATERSEKERVIRKLWHSQRNGLSWLSPSS